MIKISLYSLIMMNFLLVFSAQPAEAEIYKSKFVCLLTGKDAEKEYPQTLYHWANGFKYDAMSRSSIETGQLDFSRRLIKPATLIAEVQTGLDYHKGLFCYKNPLGAMLSGPNEVYAREDRDRDDFAAVFKLQLKLGQKFAVLENPCTTIPEEKWNYGNIEYKEFSSKVKNQDILLHKKSPFHHLDPRILTEYIILNESSVESYALDPTVLEDDIEQSYKDVFPQGIEGKADENHLFGSGAFYMYDDLEYREKYIFPIIGNYDSKDRISSLNQALFNSKHLPTLADANLSWKTFVDSNIHKRLASPEIENLKSLVSNPKYAKEILKKCAQDPIYQISLESMERQIKETALNFTDIKGSKISIGIAKLMTDRILTVVKNDEYLRLKNEEKNGLLPSEKEVENAAFSKIANYINTPQPCRKGELGCVGSDPGTIKEVFSNGNLRERMYLLYKLNFNYLQNILLKDKKRVSKIKKRMKNLGSDWALNVTFKSVFKPFSPGVEADLNSRFLLREPVKPSLFKAKIIDINSSFSPREIQFNDLKGKVKGEFFPGSAYWITGNTLRDKWHAQKTVNPMYLNNIYTEAIDTSGMKEVSGVSGTADALLTSAHLLGLKGIQLKEVRLACLAWMLENGDHSAHEILLASKSFPPLTYEIGPSFYKKIYNSSFNKSLKKGYFKEMGAEAKLKKLGKQAKHLPAQIFAACIQKENFLREESEYSDSADPMSAANTQISETLR